MNNEILEYQRDRALDWLRGEIKEPKYPSDLDKDLDALIRKAAKLPEGPLYGFVRLSSDSQSHNGPHSNGSQSRKEVEPDVEQSHIRATQDTFIKRQAIASNYLGDNEKTLVSKNVDIAITEVKQDKNQHLWIKLPNNREGFIYAPHWKLPESVKNREVKLDVPYFSQRDNWEKFHGPGWRQCCLTSHCMAADFVLKRKISQKAREKGYQEPEDLYGEVLYKYGDTTNPDAHTPALKEFGIESYFTYTGSIKDLLLCLDRGVPVPIGVAYKASGHYVCAVGYKAEGVYIHDPYGIRIGFTDNYENSSGAYDIVTWDWLQAKWVDQGSEAGWMRVITAVNGIATGLSSKL